MYAHYLIFKYPHPGGIIAGVVSDLLNARAVTCVAMLLLAVPSVRQYIAPILHDTSSNYKLHVHVHDSSGLA